MTSIDKADMYIDGGARGNPGPAAGAYVIKVDGRAVKSAGRFIEHATNNVAEYTALVTGLQEARSLDIAELSIFSDSELLVRQITGKYKVKSESLIDLFQQAQSLLIGFDRWQIRHIRRELNKEADAVVNSTIDAALGGVTDQIEMKASGVVEVIAEVISPPHEGVCGCAVRTGQSFVFTDVVPQGLCIHAAATLLAIVMSIQNDPDVEETEPLKVRCSKGGCGAQFRVMAVL